MTKKINQLDVEGFEAYTPNCQFDLESPDFVSAAAKFDLDCLDALLSVKPDCITQSFWSPKNARDGVLQTEGNFLTSLCARKEGFSRQRCGALTRKGTTRLCKLLPSKRRCKFHGGASTGPRTSARRKRIAEAQRQRCAAWRKAKMLNQ
jgi:hypothetical protein